MKSALILLLTVALAGSAFFTRPSKDSFDTMVKAQAEAQGGSFTGAMINGVKADAFLSATSFKDNYLWTSVAHDGKTIYVGAFGHWFERGKVIEVQPQRQDTVKIKLPV
jgi:hypothetical protein